MSNTSVYDVRHAFSYKDGKLFWMNPAWNRPDLKGRMAGCIHHTGYLIIGFKGKQWLGHRLIWFYHFGSIPDILDHKNRIRSDNRIENLRGADRSSNGFNISARKGKKTPVGVTKTTDGKYQARIRQEYLGCFESAEDAKVARDQGMIERGIIYEQ